jgi:hypothetical protein
MKRWAHLPAFLVVAFSIAPRAGAEHPRNLEPIHDGATYLLADDFVATEKAATFTLKAGKYVAAFENDKAIFLLGGLECLEMHVVPPKQPEHAYTQAFTCGIQYPKAATEQARFFVVRAPLPHDPSFGVLVNAIIKAGEGNFDYPISKKRVVDLRTQLTVVESQPSLDGPGASPAASDAGANDGRS